MSKNIIIPTMMQQDFLPVFYKKTSEASSKPAGKRFINFIFLCYSFWIRKPEMKFIKRGTDE